MALGPLRSKTSYGYRRTRLFQTLLLMYRRGVVVEVLGGLLLVALDCPDSAGRQAELLSRGLLHVLDRYALCVVGWCRVRTRLRPLDSSIHPCSSTRSVRCYSSRAKVAMYVIHPMGGCCLLISDLSEKILSWPASQPARGQTAACQPPASRLRPGQPARGRPRAHARRQARLTPLARCGGALRRSLATAAAQAEGPGRKAPPREPI